MATVDGFDAAVFPYTTDMPFLRRWGQPLLFGPGSIHVAHTSDEFIDIDEQHAAVDDYAAHRPRTGRASRLGRTRGPVRSPGRPTPMRICAPRRPARSRRTPAPSLFPTCAWSSFAAGAAVGLGRASSAPRSVRCVAAAASGDPSWRCSWRTRACLNRNERLLRARRYYERGLSRLDGHLARQRAGRRPLSRRTSVCTRPRPVRAGLTVPVD